MNFKLHATDGAARRGTLTLAHGAVETPAFMPVGTYGTVKAMSPAELEGMGAQVVLGNTFHLWLRPGLDVIRAHGGLHGFMGWKGPILTDSGGFQVFSLGALRKMSEEGVAFQSPINGDRMFLTPEESMNIQRVLDSDIVMIFDECTGYPATREQGTDRPGRSNASVGVIRSAMEETDWHHIAEERFASELAEALYRHAHANLFEKLVVIAPPKVLGNLRKAFHSAVAERVTAEIPKELTSHPISEIERLVAA